MPFCQIASAHRGSKQIEEGKVITRGNAKLFVCLDCYSDLSGLIFIEPEKNKLINQDEFNELFKHKGKPLRAKDKVESEIRALLEKEANLSTNEIAEKLEMSKEWTSKILRNMEGLRRHLRGSGNKEVYHYSLKEIKGLSFAEAVSRGINEKG